MPSFRYFSIGCYTAKTKGGGKRGVPVGRLDTPAGVEFDLHPVADTVVTRQILAPANAGGPEKFLRLGFCRGGTSASATGGSLWAAHLASCVPRPTDSPRDGWEMHASEVSYFLVLSQIHIHGMRKRERN